MAKGRGTSQHISNSFEKHAYEADEGFRIEDQERIDTKFIRIYPKSLVNPVPSADVPLNWSVNPYQGCEHGCSYCFARPTHEYWGYSAGIDFEQTILVKDNAADLLRQKFQSRAWKGEPVMLSGNTDCYQPAERQLKITRSLLEVCLQHRNPVGIITKNALVTRDIDLLAELNKSQLCSVTLSITTLDEDLRRNLEPRTSSVKQKLKAIEQLSEKGIPVSVMMAPIIPGLNSDEIMKLAEAVSKAGARSLSYTIVRLNGPMAVLFSTWLERHYPNKTQKVLKLIADCHGGQLEDKRTGTRMRGEGEFAAMIKQQMTLAKKRYNLNQKSSGLNSKAFTRTG